MKLKFTAGLLAAVLLISLAGCGRHSSSYRATMLVRSETSDSVYMSFSTLDGRMVFRMKCTDGQKIRYEGKLMEGDLCVYCDAGGGESELFRLRSGESLNDVTGSMEKGAVYIIVETSGMCSEGRLAFELE